MWRTSGIGWLGVVWLHTACGLGTVDVVESQRAPGDAGVLGTVAVDAGSGNGDVDAGTIPLDPVDGGPGLEPPDAGLPSAAPSCASIAAALPAGWWRGAATRFSEVPSINYAGHFLNPFPVTGSFGRFVTRDDEYLAIEFDTPLDPTSWSALQRIDWGESQVGGAAVLSDVYLSVSTCPGDFRIPGPEDAPANDPTFARGCRSVRQRDGFPLGPRSNLPYVVGTAPSTAEVCRLAPGRRYFLNFIRANAMDGRIGPPAEEARCNNPALSSCGIQLRVD
jgi:hypothetical protein